MSIRSVYWRSRSARASPLRAMAQESLIDVYLRALENDPAIREAEATYLATRGGQAAGAQRACCLG